MIELIKFLIYYPFVNLLTFFTWATPGHYLAIGIILLTLVVRLILMIPTKKQAQAQRRTMQLAPLIEDLKKEYAEDKQGLAMAQMELYKKNGINPFASCGLALIQLPILLVLYYAIQHSIGGDTTHLYSWLPRPDFINTNFFGLDLAHPDKLYILPAIAAALQFVQMRMVIPKKQPGVTEDAMVSMNRNMSYFFPLITLFIAGNFPAGVALYWIISTGFSVLQQRQVNKENLTLTGVSAAVEKADKTHPGFKHSTDAKEVIAEETSSKKGVTVTVRKKK